MSINELNTVGMQLKAAREAKGLTIDDVSQKLHIHEKYVTALEASDIKGLPDKVYAKGYLKNYARLLGLPVDKALAGWDALTPSEPPVQDTLHLELPTEQEGEDVPVKPIAVEVLSKPRKVINKAKWLKIIALIFGAALTAVAVYAAIGWFNAPKAHPVASEPSAQAPINQAMATDAYATSAAVMPPAAVGEVQYNPDGTIASPLAADGTVMAGAAVMPNAQAYTPGNYQGQSYKPKPVNKPKVTRQTSAESATTQDGEIAAETLQAFEKLNATHKDDLQLDFNQDASVVVRNEGGNVVASGSKKAGESVKVTDKAPYTIELSNGSAATGTLNDEHLPTSNTKEPSQMRVTTP